MSEDPTKISFMSDPVRRRMRGYTAHQGMPFDVPFISQVSGNLWQGGCEQGLVLPYKFKHLISLYPWEKYRVQRELETEVYVRQYDSDDDDPSFVVRLAEMANWCASRGPTLVHCQAGLNRSARVVATALMLRGWSADEAIDHLREVRSPAVLCNRGFEAWLRELEPALAETES